MENNGTRSVALRLGDLEKLVPAIDAKYVQAVNAIVNELRELRSAMAAVVRVIGREPVQAALADLRQAAAEKERQAARDKWARISAEFDEKIRAGVLAEVDEVKTDSIVLCSSAAPSGAELPGVLDVQKHQGAVGKKVGDVFEEFCIVRILVQVAESAQPTAEPEAAS